MRRVATALTLTVLSLALAAPASAGKPTRGCPNDRFDRMDYPSFVALSLSVGVPPELLGPEHAAGWDVYDRNDDGDLCVMDLPDTPGHLGTWVFNVVDNTANS